MPRLQDIEQFKASLHSLGKEAEALKRWGESFQDIQPPPQGVPNDIAALLGSGDEPSNPGDKLDAAEPDFTSFLEDLPLGAEVGDSAAPDSAFDEQEAAPAADEFEMPGGFGEQGLDAFDLDSLGMDTPESASPAPSPESPSTALVEEVDDFSVPESLLSGLADADSGAADADSFGLEDIEPLSEEAPVAESDGFPEPESPLGDMPAFSDMGASDDLGASDDMGAFDIEPATQAPDGGERTDEAASFDTAGIGDQDLGSSDIDSFGLDDLDSFSEPSASGAPVDEFSVPGEEIGKPDDLSMPEDLSALESEGEENDRTAGDAFELGSESAGSDSFEQFDLGGAPQDFGSFDAEVPDLGADDFSKGMGPDEVDGQLAALEGETPTADNFSLDSGWGDDFTIPGFEMGSEDKAKAAKAAKPADKQAGTATPGREATTLRPEKKARPVELTDAQVDKLQDTVLSYPLNLRLAVEDIIANARGSDVLQSELIWMLVEGASARDASKLAGRILKRFIEVPAGFAKRTGAALEAEKGSLPYIFIHSILPVLQILLLVAAGAGAMFFLGYNFAYRPLRANSLYAEGHRQLGLDKYSESLELFDRADDEWTMKHWYYRYAEAYAERGQFSRSEAMYVRLLDGWPKETKAALDYARMESESLLAFDKAEEVLKRYILGRDYFNEQALLLSADNYLAWADFEEQQYDGPDADFVASLYEKARLQLAMLMEHHNRSDAYLERMLVYFIRTERSSGKDKIKEILPLAKYFVGNVKSTWSAATLAELGEYLIDRNETENVNVILLAAVDKDGSLPEAHVAMAAWNRRSGFPADELKALEFAARFYDETDVKTGLSTKRAKRYIESMIRLGELRRADGRSIDAEDALNKAINRYERSLEERRFKRDARFGLAYARLADIYYAERRDFPGALALYSKAERNGYASKDTDYRRGYMHYMAPADDGSEALRFFYRAGLDADVSPYLVWATANALYARADYFAAQGYYTMLADRLQFELDTLALPSPQIKPSHNEIVELLMMTRNNLGASYYRVAERMSDVRRRSEAMVEFTESARLWDSLSRDQESMKRSGTKNMGFLNLDFILHPQRGIDMGIYKYIPTEMTYPRK